MTTPFDGGPANPFADNSQPAQQQPTQQAPTEPVNPFAGVAADAPSPQAASAPVQQQPAQQPTQQPVITDPFGSAQQAAPAPQQAAPAPQQMPMQSPLAPQTPPAQQFGAPQGTFGGGNAFGGGNSGGSSRKYKIFDLYWLINRKLYKEEQLAPNEVAVLNISYNIDFDNLRLSFCTPGADTFTQTGMELKSMDRKTTVNICAEMAEQITDLLTVESGRVNNLERVFQNNSNWAPNQTSFSKNGNTLVITTNTKNGETYTYAFEEWQLKALNHACIFLLKEARILTLSKMGIG